MDAKVGDEIVIRGHHVDEADRTAQIIDIRGTGGQPPYLVRWKDGHESLIFPGPDARIRH